MRHEGSVALPGSPLRPTAVLLGLLLAASLGACQSPDRRGEAPDARTVVDVRTTDYAFRGVPDSIPSGWTTFRVDNDGQHVHLLELARLPEGVTAPDWREGFATIRALTRQLRAGTIDTTDLVARRPDWVGAAHGTGGLGYLSPGRTARLTTRLAPGTYALTCYVRTAEGRRHWELGMERALTVTADSTGAAPPAADLTLRLSGYEIRADDALRAGPQTIAVHFGGPTPTEAPLQDVHLARLSGDESLDTLAAWANGPAGPAPADFLGGTIAMGAGNTAYLTVEVRPGRYAWVSHASEEKGMMRTFAVD
jgi:hypothetical protein